MKLNRGTWVAIALVAIVLALLNLHAWQPGIGGRTDRINGVQPIGSELELYYGWPACYRAELLRSDDPGMGSRVLETAPLYLPPYAEGWVSARYVSRLAIVLDALFALLGIALVGLFFECGRRAHWPRWAVIATLLIAFTLAAGYWSAESVSVHL
jgi:hypothetical protein